jgi:anti-sigma regulatory factor (Ser/Thr protein kinase)
MAPRLAFGPQEEDGLGWTMGFATEIQPSTIAAADVRRSVGDHFATSISKSQLHDLQVVVGELVSNSVEHGPGGPIQVRVDLNEQGDLRGEVEDQGDGLVSMIDMADTFERGLGLYIVDALTDEWAVYEGSTHVWFEIRGVLPPLV